jgi:signal transduction histidine kinase/CheY-like chemotaxis protein
MALASDDSVETRVLVTAPVGRDAKLVQETLESAGIACRICADLADLRSQIVAGAGAVVLTEEALDRKGVQEVAEVARGQLPWSQLPFLLLPAVSARVETLSPRVARLMEFVDITILDRPIRRVALISAVRAALRARGRQYQVRDLLLELESGVRDRDRFLAILGHELRNPLGAILLSIQLLEKKGSAALPRERAVILRQARLLSRLVDDLLDVSRVTSGKIALQRAPVDLRELAERCVQSVAVSAAAQRTELTLEAGETAAVVQGDTVRLEQVMNNLLTNALKYTPPGGHVKVEISAGAEEVVLRVSDTGVGIDPLMLSRVFELFAQADNSLDRAQGGLGIGLTLVRSLVELHGGSVSAASSGRGEGSTFAVRLPRLRGARPPGPAGATETAERVASRRILLIEDNADVREGLRLLLQETGHCVEAAEDGERGVAAAIAFAPEVALIDIGLPRMDGYSVAGRIREALGNRVVLVALTGYGLPEDRVRAREAGFDAHIPKPASLGAIQSLLAGL